MNKPIFNQLLYMIPTDQKIRVDMYDEKSESVKVKFSADTKVELNDTLREFTFYYDSIMQLHAEFIDGEAVIVITV